MSLSTWGKIGLVLACISIAFLIAGFFQPEVTYVSECVDGAHNKIIGSECVHEEVPLFLLVGYFFVVCAIICCVMDILQFLRRFGG